MKIEIATFNDAYQRELEAGNSGKPAEEQAIRNVLSSQSMALTLILDKLARIEQALSLEVREAGGNAGSR